MKRTADTLVRHTKDTKDITDAETFVTDISKACPSVRLYLIKSSEIATKQKQLQKATLKTVPGTMKIHYVRTSQPYSIQYADVSCLCLKEACVHQAYRSFTFSRTETDQRKENQSGSDDVSKPVNLKQKGNNGKNSKTVKMHGKKRKMTEENSGESDAFNEPENFFTSCVIKIYEM